MIFIKKKKLILFSLIGILIFCQGTYAAEISQKKSEQKKLSFQSIKTKIAKPAKIIAYSTIGVGALVNGISTGYFTKKLIDWKSSGPIASILLQIFPTTKYTPLAAGASSLFSFFAAWYFLTKAYEVAKN